MAQTDFGTIDPATKSGTALATDLNDWRDSVHSSHSGSSAPSYLVEGMPWYDTDTNILSIYNGTSWGAMFDFTSGVAMDGVVIGATTPATITATQFDIDSTTPTIYLNETDGTSTFQKVIVTLASGAFVVGTRTDANGFVSNDYVMDRDASGATNHSFKIAGSEVLGVTSAGISTSTITVDNSSGFIFGSDTDTGVSLMGTNTVGFTCGGSFRVAADTTSFRPWADNVYSCGTSSTKWSVVYAGTGTINTSDINLKTDIEELSEAETRVAKSVKGLLRRYRWKDAVEEKGDSARYHFGVMAQEVVAAFDAEGLDAHRYGMICLDDTEDGERYGVRYDELLAFIIAAM